MIKYNLNNQKHTTVLQFLLQNYKSYPGRKYRSYGFLIIDDLTTTKQILKRVQKKM